MATINSCALVGYPCGYYPNPAQLENTTMTYIFRDYPDRVKNSRILLAQPFHAGVSRPP